MKLVALSFSLLILATATENRQLGAQTAAGSGDISLSASKKLEATVHRYLESSKSYQRGDLVTCGKLAGTPLPPTPDCSKERCLIELLSFGTSMLAAISASYVEWQKKLAAMPNLISYHAPPPDALRSTAPCRLAMKNLS